MDRFSPAAPQAVSRGNRGPEGGAKGPSKVWEKKKQVEFPKDRPGWTAEIRVLESGGTPVTCLVAHQERFPPLSPFFRPQNPSSIASFARETCPPAVLLHPSLITPPPTFPLDPPALSVPKLPNFQEFLEIICAHMNPERLRSLKKHPPTHHSSRTPHPSPLHPHCPQNPWCCTISPKIAHFKAFLEVAWAHLGQGWRNNRPTVSSAVGAGGQAGANPRFPVPWVRAGGGEPTVSGAVGPTRPPGHATSPSSAPTTNGTPSQGLPLKTLEAAG